MSLMHFRPTWLALFPQQVPCSSQCQVSEGRMPFSSLSSRIFPKLLLLSNVLKSEEMIDSEYVRMAPRVAHNGIKDGQWIDVLSIKLLYIQRVVHVGTGVLHGPWFDGGEQQVLHSPTAHVYTTVPAATVRSKSILIDKHSRNMSFCATLPCPHAGVCPGSAVCVV